MSTGPKKPIEELQDADLAAIWPVIGGAPHLFEHGKVELSQILRMGEIPEQCGLFMDFYTMAAIVDILRHRGFDTPDYISML
jgi:hypothetical protein